jgi:hypothetical protein
VVKEPAGGRDRGDAATDDDGVLSGQAEQPLSRRWRRSWLSATAPGAQAAAWTPDRNLPDTSAFWVVLRVADSFPNEPALGATKRPSGVLRGASFACNRAISCCAISCSMAAAPILFGNLSSVKLSALDRSWAAKPIEFGAQSDFAALQLACFGIASAATQR